MRIKKGYNAFSLTELLIVIVIIAVLFAALAPIITKRHVAETHQTESIWNFVTGDIERDAYFDPGVETWTSSVYVGMVPTANDAGAGKLVVDSGQITYNGASYNQPQIQFRFSTDSKQQGRGLDAANLYVSDSSIVFGSSLSPYNTSKSTIYGTSNLINNTYAHSLTVMGAGAMQHSLLGKNGGSTPQYIIAIGNRAAEKFGASNTTQPVNGIFIGSGSGLGSAETTVPPTGNIALGYNSMAYVDHLSPSDTKKETKGLHNVFIGADTGNGFTDTSASYNTIVGSVFAGSGAANNTIIGYDVYSTGDPNVSNLTAIGYNSCNSMTGNSGSKTCIGYTSGYSTNNTPSTFNTDTGEHIFLGGKPSSKRTRGFAGRSVLEVHNNTINGVTYGNVVINSNLVVRGNFFPADNEGNLSVNTFTDTNSVSYGTYALETPYYRCSSDAYQSILNYNNFVCKELITANPKSVNVFYRLGSCSTNDGYPNGNGCPNISSDIRLKTAISPNNDGLEKLLKLQPYNYEYKSKPHIHHVGVIAQELKQIFPNAVSVDDNGYFKIRFEDMFYALINSLKQLAQKIDDLSNKISVIKNDLFAIKSDQKNIKRQISLINSRVKKLEREHK